MRNPVGLWWPYRALSRERCCWRKLGESSRATLSISVIHPVGVLGPLTLVHATVNVYRIASADAALERRRERGLLAEVELRGECHQIFHDSIGLLEIGHVTAGRVDLEPRVGDSCS
jgi:hypothetical protein